MCGKWGPFSLLAVLALSGCATIPAGPSVMVLPAQGKPFEVFQADDALCRQWAGQQIGMAPSDAANQNMAASAAVGTLLGAGLGAAIGAASGSAGVGAAIGAGSGALGGTLMGVNSGYASSYELQRRYDIAYQQCMYAKGNQIPGVVNTGRSSYRTPPPPPPPPGMEQVPSAPPRKLAPPPPPQ